MLQMGRGGLTGIPGDRTGSELRWTKSRMGTRARLWDPLALSQRLGAKNWEAVEPVGIPKDRTGREGRGVRKNFRS